MQTLNMRFLFCFEDAVIYYDWFIPEAERHDSALTRNKEALVTELKLWEGYLDKVAMAQQTCNCCIPRAF